MSVRTARVHLGAATLLAAVWLVLFGGCGTGGAADAGSGSGSTGGTAPETATTAATLATPTAEASPSITSVVGVSGPSTSLALRPTSLSDLSTEIRGLLGDSGVPVYLPLAMPLGYHLAATSPEDQVRGKSNPSAWQLGGTRPGLRTAGYAVLYTDGAHLIRLDVNPAGDLGDVQWVDGGIEGVYGPLRTTTAAGTTWVGLANPDGVEIMVSGDTGLSQALLLLASKVARADGG